MTYTYVSFASPQADDKLWSSVKNQLNKLNSIQASSAKVAASDMKGDDARAIIIHCNSKAPEQLNLGTTWSYKVFETGSDYEKMYGECVNFLNGPTLNDAQKYYALLTMTNAEGHDSRLVLFYRSMQ